MKIIIHVKHCLLNGSRNAVVKTVDTSVIALLLVNIFLLNSEYEIELDLNFGKNKKVYKTNDVWSGIKPEQQFAHMFFTLLLVLLDILCQTEYIGECFIKLIWAPYKAEEN